MSSRIVSLNLRKLISLERKWKSMSEYSLDILLPETYLMINFFIHRSVYLLGMKLEIVLFLSLLKIPFLLKVYITPSNVSKLFFVISSQWKRMSNGHCCWSNLLLSITVSIGVGGYFDIMLMVKIYQKFILFGFQCSIISTYLLDSSK